MGGLGKDNNTSTPTVLPDDFDGFFGQRRNIDALTSLEEVRANNSINPNYRRIGKDDGYSTNCAICSTGVVLQARGYDVEALTQPAKANYGWYQVFDLDYTNPDNYMVPSSTTFFDLTEDNVKARASRQLQRQGMSVEEARLTVPTMKIQKTPRGADKVAKAIEEKVKSWGNGAIGEVDVSWKNRSSNHAINVINQNGTVVLYDSQINKTYTDLSKFFAHTNANNTQLVRLDNAPIKQDAKQYINKMFKKRGS